MIDTRLKVRKKRWRQSIFDAYEKKVLNHFLSPSYFSEFLQTFCNHNFGLGVLSQRGL
jgi:hypothetical protein